MGSNRKTLINVICSMMVLVTNTIISFWLSPYIVKNIGVEANGFVTLANNFVGYANLIVMALNSMAGRFITIEYVKKNYNKANVYYNSVFWGNFIIAVVLLIPAMIIIIFLEYFINIPLDILWDVKILFSFTFLNFFLGVALPNWDCGTYVTNRLDRAYIPQMVTSIFKCIFLVLIFTIFVPHVYYVGLAALIISIILFMVNWYNTHTLTPELKIQFSKGEILYSPKAVKKLVSSGVWNTISNIGNMLLSGLDLIICNIYLGSSLMGVLSLSKIIPNYIQQLSASIRNAFAPELTINYAKNDKAALYKDINRAMKLTSVIMTVPIAIVIVLGDRFFSLWVPSQDAKLLQILSILSILGYMFTSGTQILFNVFSAVDKVKANSVAMVISGVCSCTITIMFVKYTDYGIFAVAGVSTICNLVRNMVYTVPVTAKYLGFKWNKFYPQVFITISTSILMVAIGFGIKILLPYGSWTKLMISAIILGVIGLAINIAFILNKEERKFLDGIIRKKILKKRKGNK